MRNLIEYAAKALKEDKPLVWSGCGPAVGKTISCVELIKRSFHGPTPVQQNLLQKVWCEEHWDPKVEGLDPLVVYRDLPTIHILLAKEPINENLPGYQGPKSAHFSKRKNGGGNRRRGGGHQEFKRRVNPDEMAGLGLRSQPSLSTKKQQQYKKLQGKVAMRIVRIPKIAVLF